MKLDLLVQLRAAGLPLPVTEFAFAAPARRWRLDYYWPAPHYLALEQEGGVWTAGRHTRGKGFMGDLEKYNTATLMGIRILRATPKQIADGTALGWLQQALQADQGGAGRPRRD